MGLAPRRWSSTTRQVVAANPTCERCTEPEHKKRPGGVKDPHRALPGAIRSRIATEEILTPEHSKSRCPYAKYNKYVEVECLLI